MKKLFSISLLLCFGLLSFAQPNMHTLKYLYGHANSGGNIIYNNKGQVAFQQIYGDNVLERWMVFDSSDFADSFVGDTAVTLTRWGPFGAILDMKLIYQQVDSPEVQAYVYDFGALQVNDTIASPTPFYGIQDTLYHFVEDIFTDSNLPTPADSNSYYILYLRYLKKNE